MSYSGLIRTRAKKDTGRWEARRYDARRRCVENEIGLEPPAHDSGTNKGEGLGTTGVDDGVGDGRDQ